MGILDEKRYAESMTRTEIADALKNGHPLVAGYLVADAAKQMEENDALVKVLEQQAGLPQPGQTISDKLEAYLREPISERRVAQQQPGVGGLNLMPGPPGVGGPMPGPRMPGGAGGPMPGTQRGPQGVGAPMRSGGVVGYQEGGIAEDLTYDEDPEQELDWATSWTEKPDVGYGPERSIAGDIGRLLARGGAGVRGGAAAGIYGGSRAYEALLPGQQYGPDSSYLERILSGVGSGAAIGGGAGALFGGVGAIPGAVIGGLTGGVGSLLHGGLYDPEEAQRKAAETGWSGRKELRDVPLTEEERARAKARAEIDDWVSKQEESGAGAGVGRSAYQDLFEKIEEYANLAKVPTESEKNRYKLDEDRARDLRGRRAGIEALMPTAEEDALRGRGVSFGALSKVLARTGDPRKRQDFGQIGEAISGETDRQLDQRLRFEDKLAGIDTSIYGVEGQGLDRRGLRERADDPFKAVELKAIQSEIESKQARELAVMAAMAKQREQNDYLRAQNIPSVIAMINEPTIIDYIKPEQIQTVVETIMQRLTSGSSSDEISRGDYIELLNRLQAKQAS